MTLLRHSFFLVFPATGLAVLLLLAGCWGGTEPPVSVKGKVTLMGKPFTVGEVVFAPDKDNLLKVQPRGKIDANGSFELSTEGRTGTGVPAGWYIAYLEIIEYKGSPAVPGSIKYRNATQSPFRIQVTADAKPGAYDLVLTEN